MSFDLSKIPLISVVALDAQGHAIARGVAVEPSGGESGEPTAEPTGGPPGGPAPMPG
ncbi:hypothetical protein J5X84_07525 [Streptosporangiaceae bacterium NEAU-GS5]|nr:hypothetical protein [Streptosporangiaceae bacterium NEAU-GS5]